MVIYMDETCLNTISRYHLQFVDYFVTQLFLPLSGTVYILHELSDII